MDELLMFYAKKHAPHMPQEYHDYTVYLMKHMIYLTNKHKES